MELTFKCKECGEELSSRGEDIYRSEVVISIEPCANCLEKLQKKHQESLEEFETTIEELEDKIEELEGM